MNLRQYILNNDLSIDQLEKSLKAIGLNLSLFEGVREDKFEKLISDFKQTIHITPKSSRQERQALRSKFEIILREARVENDRNQTQDVTSLKENGLKNRLLNDLRKSNEKGSLNLRSEDKNLGIVKFFNPNKGFGYLHCLNLSRDCYMHVSSLNDTNIEENDIVVFDVIPSDKKAGELNAINVSNLIPAFIFNRPSSDTSFIIPLLNDGNFTEFQLSDKLENSFTTVLGYKTNNKWKVKPITAIGIAKEAKIAFGKREIVRLFSNVRLNIDAIDFLFNFLKNELGEIEIQEQINQAILTIEQKSIADVNDDIAILCEMNWFKDHLQSWSSSINKISYSLWALGELPSLPYAKSEEDLTIWRTSIVDVLNWDSLLQTLNLLYKEQGPTSQVEEAYRCLLEQQIEITNKEELNAVIDLFVKLRKEFPLIQMPESIFQCSSNDQILNLYENGLIKTLSEEFVISYLNNLTDDIEKVKFIEKQDTENILKYYLSYPSLRHYQDLYVAHYLSKQFSSINYLCFDLEYDGVSINEFAWKHNSSLKSHDEFRKKEDGLLELINLINSLSITVGHNIREFDLPVLTNHGAVPKGGGIWDTLEMEMLLNPNRFSYALKTQHNAKSDTEFTDRLFRNQMARIIVSESTFNALKSLIPEPVLEAVMAIQHAPIWTQLGEKYFNDQSNEFFRPNPTNQNISAQTFNQLTEKLNEEGSKIVIAPEFLWNTLSYQFDLAFYSDNKFLGVCLNKDKIEAALRDDKLLKTILLRFVDCCISKGLQPYFQHLPMAIRLKLDSEQSTLICDNIDVDFRKIDHKPICIKPTDIEIINQHGNQFSDLKVIILGNELYNLTSKLQLGQDFDFAIIFDRLKNEPIWLQMSGGKSFISIEQSHCRKLGITEFPEFVQNIWLEKIGKGKFKVWCNLNFEAYINNLPINEAHYIDWIDETFTKENSFIVRPDARRSGYIAEQKRVNPESLYRKLYWAYQFKLFEGIENTNNPKVLIVNDELETEKLLAFARRRGYFIPDTKASLARQVELLHTHRSSNNLLIASFSTLDKVISSNYSGPIDFIWDSFLLQEKLQMLKGNIPVELETNEAQKEDDYRADVNSIKKDYDLFTLIKLHKPLIDYYYKMLYDNNPDSQLFLCDTRLVDFYGIEKSLNLNTKSVQMWFKEADYDADKALASEFFSSTHENADTNFDIDEAKEILRQIFLMPEDGGVPYQWHDYQHPCLNEILPAKKDLLISLPTGAGKSLLFQGPALFRSAFSCKLSIVISPLRALMQDQVYALWNKGFYSNVEFLSGDKSHVEIRDIYRRISGGEITLLYITPERFRSRAFENCLLTRLDSDSGLEYAVFDEAHCISQWGQEFRPDYLNAGRRIAGFSEIYQVRKLLFSATISEQVFEEIGQLMPGVVTVEGTEKSYNPVRDHIKMDFKHNVVEDERLLEIANYLKTGRFNPTLSRAIVFVKSRKKVEECTLIMPDVLRDVFGSDCDFAEKVGAFHAGMDAEDRKDTYEKFSETNEIVILFATKAFGMGMDIPNIHFVTHYSPPSTFEDFLQEVGRAGRNEKQRLEAGFNNSENPIKTLCLTTNNDFAKLKDQLHESRISWHEVKDIKQVLEDYITRFKPLTPDSEIPVAVPFNLYSNEKGSVNDDLDNKFRIALHWLERLERIKLGYFTITHLEFESASLQNLAERINKCSDKDCEKVCYAILELLPSDTQSNKVVQLSIASLRSITKLSLENLFTALLKNHAAGILKLLQNVVIEPTNLRNDELIYYSKGGYKNKYPALKTIFAFAKEILNSTRPIDSKTFDGDELDQIFKNCIYHNLNFAELPWPINPAIKSSLKSREKYITDLTKKRFKHAFTIIRLLGKTRCTSEFEKVIDSNQKVKTIQTVYNGYHKREEWSNKIAQLENDCIKLLDYLANQYFDKNIKNFNWPDIISALGFKGNAQYLSDLLFILSVLGYSKTGGLLPTGIEIDLTSIENIDETDLQSFDKKIFEEFEETRKVRELKLIALEVLAGFQKGGLGNEPSAVRKKQDTFIRKYFGCNSLESLLQLLQDELPPNDPLLFKWRGDAIKAEEDRLNEEQRKVYDADINQHINVMAGPGSGKTHTLTLRVARLVHHIGTNPEEILVLAYNRAVVSELKERLGRLFNDLGYGNLSKRIKIFTFHGLAKRYCQNEIQGQPFDEWEAILLRQLNNAPGQIMNQLAPLKHILVDEFQDINNVRIRLLKKLHELTDSHLFIIGDPNQSIYGYERIKEGGSMSPWPYYADFKEIFNPTQFDLYDNHRSYPDILDLASQILTLPEEHQHLIPRPTRVPDENFIQNYAQIIDRTQQRVDWWDQISLLMQERVGQRPYKQIAILFRTNNEVYRGFQKVKGLNLHNVRIRIQGSLPYEFTRIRECHAVVLFLKSKIGQQIPIDFKQTFRVFINDLISHNQNWNHFYIRVIHALVLEYLEEQDESQMFDNLLDFITELTYKDDGQLYRIYEKHLDRISAATHETEIVLTTMHKVKGLEFDCVIVPPSFSNLPLKINDHLTNEEFQEQLDEEKRLAFVAYTRARYRLIIFKHFREIALANNNRYVIPDNATIGMGIPVQPEIKKLKIGWAAKAFNFNTGVNNYINTSVKSGDFVFVRRRVVPNNGNHFVVQELLKENTTRPIGELANNANIIKDHQTVSGFVVNEVVVWTYEDTCKFDTENDTNFAGDWCQEARNQGYIYLVDFAGFGIPNDM
jgi:ATP-dependent DNA helicase RecQ